MSKQRKKQNRSIRGKTAVYFIVMLYAILFFSGPVICQSVYSAAGIGKYRYFINGRSSGMGGVGIAATDDMMYNIQNPAAGAFLKNTTVTSGFLYEGLRIGQQNNEFNNALSRWSGVNFSIKFIDRFGIAGGIVPFSDFKFDIGLADEGQDYTRAVEGRGGLSRGFGAFALKITPNISVGLMISRYFGRLEEEFFVIFNESGLYDTFNSIETTIFGNNYRIGGLLQKSRYSLGGYYSLGADLTGKSQLTISMVLPQQITRFPVHIPAQWGMGGMAKLSRGWITGLDIQGLSFNKLVLGNSIQQFQNSYLLSAGGEFSPVRGMDPGLFSRIQYRCGMSYGKLYVTDLDGSSIKELSLSLGIGIPFSRYRGRMDVAFEIGTRGSKTEDLVQERFVRLSVVLGVREQWFQNRSERRRRGEEEEDKSS